MKKNIQNQLVMLALIALPALNSPFSTAQAQTTAFTYQGRLNDANGPANGLYDMTFTVWTASTAGTQVAGPLTNSAVAVSNGLFSVSLDFGAGLFTGTNYWVELAVGTNGGGSFLTLAPRQQLTPTPYAIFASTAGNVSGPIPAAQLSGTIANGNLPASPSFAGTVTAGTFSGSGATLTALNAGNLASGTVPLAQLSGLTGNQLDAATWQLATNLNGGNAAALNGLNASNFWQLGGNNVASGQFIGSTNNQPMEIWVNGQRTIQLSPTANDTYHSNCVNFVGGAPMNFIPSGVYGSVIVGGGAPSYALSAWTNSVSADMSFLGGGMGNSIQLYSAWSFIGGGTQNSIQTQCSSATLVGGAANSIQSLSSYTFIGGGDNNSIQQSVFNSFIGGGELNSIQTNSSYSALVGGRFNSIQANAQYSFLGGGSNNSILSNAQYATIAGGLNNAATNNAFAAGSSAKAIHTGAFVWADSQPSAFSSTTTNQFNVRASGGVRFVTGGAGATLDGQPILAGAISAGSLSGSYTNAVSFTNAGNLFAGNGGGLSNVNASTVGGLDVSNFWQVGGNNVANGQFLGSTNNQAVTIKAYGMQALQLQPVINAYGYTNMVNVVAGSPLNYIASGVSGAVIAGGGADRLDGSSGFGNSNSVSSDMSAVGGGMRNAIQANATASVLSGGQGNAIGQYADHSSIGGGYFNSIQGSASYSFLGGGNGNSIQLGANRSVLVGGGGNSIQTNASFSVLGGGSQNSILANNSFLGSGQNNSILAGYSVLGGGSFNLIQSNAQYDVIGGGYQNSIQAGPYAADFGYSFIGGGRNNSIQAGASYSTIAGGSGNSIQTNSSYCFIGGGSRHTVTAYSQNATILGGDACIATSYSLAAGDYAWATNTGSFVWSDGTATITPSVANNSVTMRASGGFRFFTGTGTAGAQLAAGATAWSVLSDRNQKKDFAAVDVVNILDKLAAIPVTQWHYKWEDQNITPHIGPMAQDFKHAFYPGSDDKSISTLEADGVAFAAIQGLNQKLEETRAENAALKARLEKLEQWIESKHGEAK